ncbi:MAG: sigma-54-dependent Fis family transcriptional regulator [Alistipes sp.]|nr:sigma-54-dependent Fis family transcriptional regulator [Alistipes sp.]
MAEVDIMSVKQRFGIIGNSDAMNRALSVALRVAPTDLSVLVTGESGVGKEFFPQIIHAYSARKHAKYVAVNCGAIPEGTIDSELFGHEKGSFTGATEARKGYFEEADGGTIFLDEVGELPLSTQVRLLRVLQSGEFMRVGSARVQKTNVRVVAATNNDLQSAIESGRFREDLYYRLNTVPITVPALRERPEDIPLLFRKFASDVAVQYKMPAVQLDEGARQLLQSHYWRGNVRQLKNVAEQISALERSRTITADVLQSYLTPAYNTSTTMTIGGKGAASEDFSSERELLYKILFDMRSDINDLKRMLSELMHSAGAVHTPPTADVIGLLPSSSMMHPSAVSNADYAESEVVEEVTHKELTKADMQREQIIAALRSNNGRRRDAARQLFMSERTLYRRIKELGITDDDI